jgi:predicted DNA-binding transcriptional regulator YafY
MLRTASTWLSSVRCSRATLRFSRPGSVIGWAVIPRCSRRGTTASQAVAVAIALATLPPGSPFGVDATAASGKLRDALDSRQRARAQVLADRVWVMTTSPTREVAKPHILRAVERSLGERLAVSIEYRAADGSASNRIVEPVVLAFVDLRWFLVSYCQLRDGIRWFELSRIHRARLTRSSYEPRDVADIGTPPLRAQPVDVHN